MNETQYTIKIGSLTTTCTFGEIPFYLRDIKDAMEKGVEVTIQKSAPNSGE